MTGNYSDYYEKLNRRQKEAVDTIDGPVLVLAGPGTGKTQLLSVRTAGILAKKKILPENILILTFTNTAASQMKERLARIIGPEGYLVEVDTFHGFANSVIQGSEEAANYVRDKIQMSDIERVKAIEYALDHASGISEIKPFGSPYHYQKAILGRIGELKRDGITARDFADYLKNKTDWESRLEEKHRKKLGGLSVIYSMYEELKEGKTEGVFDDRGRYDYDDMILLAAESFKKESGLQAEYRSRFKYIMVDEFQDTNGAQLELLFAVAGEKSPNLACVGDDDQSIFRFQGASSGNFRILEARYPDLKKIVLEDNYRSSPELIEAARGVIVTIPKGERAGDKTIKPTKKYRDMSMELSEFSTEEEELLHITERIKALKDGIAKNKALGEEERSRPYNNIAILVRKRADILKVIDALLKAGIPYATDGKEDIGSEKRVKQLVDVLELAHTSPENHDEKDVALYKVLTADYFELPHSDILRFLDHVNSLRDKDHSRNITFLSEFLGYFDSDRDDIRFKEKKKIEAAAEVIKRLLDDPYTRTVHSVLLDFIKDSGMFKYVLRQYRDRQVLKIRELRAITSFVNMIKQEDLTRPGIRLNEFMGDMKTRKDHRLPTEGTLVTMTQDGVRVFTAHGSKGAEFHSVIIPFFLEGRSWPLKTPSELLPVPSDLFKGRERAQEKDVLKRLHQYDETRLFYVAITRAKSNLILTASPTEDAVISSFAGHLALEAAEAAGCEEEVLKSFLETTDAADPFIGTEKILKDMIKNMALNPTRLNNYMQCRRKFLYNDVLKLPGSKKQSLVFGNCVHKALEETYRHLCEKGSFPPFEFFREAFKKELDRQGVDRAIELHCSSKDQMDKLRRWFEKASKNPIVPIGLEKKLIITVGDNIMFRGKYDKMEWQDEKKGLVRILDYKTGKPDKHVKAIARCSDVASEDCDEYLRQLVAYKLLFEKDRNESKGRRASHGVLVFIEPAADDMKKLGYDKGDFVTKAVEVTDEMTKKLEDLIIDVWANIKNLKFEKLKERDEDKCRYCDFNDICWGGKK